MPGFDNIVVLVTSTDPEEAQRIADVLLKERKAACVNIVPGVDSLFWWQDKLDSAQESLLIVKTKASVLNDIIGLIRELHSYDVPEIIALPIIGGNQDYLDSHHTTATIGAIDHLAVDCAFSRFLSISRCRYSYKNIEDGKQRNNKMSHDLLLTSV